MQQERTALGFSYLYIEPALHDPGEGSKVVEGQTGRS